MDNTYICGYFDKLKNFGKAISPNNYCYFK